MFSDVWFFFQREADNATRQPYLRVVGFMQDRDGSGRSHVTFTTEEETSFLQLSKDPDLYNKIAASIAPEIFGFDGKSLSFLLHIYECI